MKIEIRWLTTALLLAGSLFIVSLELKDQSKLMFVAPAVCCGVF